MEAPKLGGEQNACTPHHAADARMMSELASMQAI
jgi:hypothetical protein